MAAQEFAKLPGIGLKTAQRLAYYILNAPEEDVEQFAEGIKKYDFAIPFTKESLLYRDIFEKYYPGQARMVKDFWMPNKTWPGCDVDDPSARVLKNYGASGK